MRKKFIAGNWKMYTTAATARTLAEGIAKSVTDDRVTVAVCPPYPWLALVADALAGSKVAVGAQNCHYASEGAYTGEVAPCMLLDAGCKYAIVGQAENSHLFVINERTNATVRNNIIKCTNILPSHFLLLTTL